MRALEPSAERRMLPAAADAVATVAADQYPSILAALQVQWELEVIRLEGSLGMTPVVPG